MSVYVPKTNKLSIVPTKVVGSTIKSMQAFIVNNLESSLHSSCIAVLDNDPNPDVTSEFYKAAQQLKLIASNRLVKEIDTFDSSGKPIIIYQNANINPQKYRLTVIDATGTVAFDSHYSLSANVNATPESPVNPSNHHNSKSVLASLLNAYFNSGSSLNNVLTQNTGNGTLGTQLTNTNNIGNGTLSSQTTNPNNVSSTSLSSEIQVFSDFKFSTTVKGMMLYVAVALTEGIQTVGTLQVSTKVTNK